MLSRNHREVEAVDEGGGANTSVQEGVRLWSCGQRGCLTQVLIERLWPYVPRRLIDQPDDDEDPQLRWARCTSRRQRCTTTARYAYVQSRENVKHQGPGKRYARRLRMWTMYSFNAKPVTLWTGLGLRNVVNSRHGSHQKKRKKGNDDDDIVQEKG